MFQFNLKFVFGPIDFQREFWSENLHENIYIYGSIAIAMIFLCVYAREICFKIK